MHTIITLLLAFALSAFPFDIALDAYIAERSLAQVPPAKPLLKPDLSNAIDTKGVWRFENGVLTASADEQLWTKAQYENFVLELDFKNEKATNSGVFVYASDLKEWMPHSLEIQIADDYDPKWGNSAPSWQCGALFGLQPAMKRTVKPAGEWNHYRITCQGQRIEVELNGTIVNQIDLSNWTSPTLNPDGTKIPAWLISKEAKSGLPTKGHIGFQGKHNGAPIYFRNIAIRSLSSNSPISDVK